MLLLLPSISTGEPKVDSTPKFVQLIELPTLNSNLLSQYTEGQRWAKSVALSLAVPCKKATSRHYFE